MIKRRLNPKIRNRLRDGAALSLLIVLLQMRTPLPARAENSVSYKWQDYSEEKGRIQVKSHYVQIQQDLNPSTTVSIMGLIDSISGASPTGQLAPAGSDQVPLAEMHDQRRALTADLAHQFGRENLSFQYAYSKESDYLSHGYSLTSLTDFNNKNTTLQLGYSYDDDSVGTRIFKTWQPKRSQDFIIGVTQLIDPKSYFTVNLSAGHSSGYLDDPYKLVQKDTEVSPGLFIPLTQPENRPDRKTKWILYTSYDRMFDSLHGSVETSFRYYHDDQGIRSETVTFAWFEKIGTDWIIRPNLRYYRQTAADFYYPNLNDTSIVPTALPTGSGPFYSSDYRLSKFDAKTYGLMIRYKPSDRFAVDVSYDRYIMHGLDGKTLQSAYPTANIFTVGARIWY